MDFFIQPVELLRLPFEFTVLESNIIALRFPNFVNRINITTYSTGNPVEFYTVNFRALQFNFHTWNQQMHTIAI